MTLTINGMTFNDARSFPLDENFGVEVIATESLWPNVTKGGVEGKRMRVEIPLWDTTSSTQAAQLRGLAEQNEFLYLESDSQDILGALRKIYVVPTSISVEPQPGTAHFKVFRMDCEVVGVPINAGGSAKISEVWSWGFI